MPILIERIEALAGEARTMLGTLRLETLEARDNFEQEVVRKGMEMIFTPKTSPLKWLRDGAIYAAEETLNRQARRKSGDEIMQDVIDSRVSVDRRMRATRSIFKESLAQIDEHMDALENTQRYVEVFRNAGVHQLEIEETVDPVKLVRALRTEMARHSRREDLSKPATPWWQNQAAPVAPRNTVLHDDGKVEGALDYIQQVKGAPDSIDVALGDDNKGRFKANYEDAELIGNLELAPGSSQKRLFSLQTLCGAKPMFIRTAEHTSRPGA
jgi:hypothetical protein